jgi:hypothetical protein
MWCWKFSQWAHLIHLIRPQTHFWAVLDYFVIARTLVQNKLNWCN